MTQAASLFVPASLLSIAAWLALLPTFPEWLATGIEVAPLAVFGSGMLLGLFTRRGRLVLGIVILALADIALVQFGGRAAFAAVGLLLPLNLAVIAWLGEASLLAARGAGWLGATLLQASVVAILDRPELDYVAEALESPLVAMNVAPWTALPQLVLAAFGAALALVLGRLCAGGRQFATGTGWALVASFLALDGAGSGRGAIIYLVTAGVLLVVGAVLEPAPVAFADTTTGLPGRLALNAALRRLPRRYALASVEIDEFRVFRDEHGADAARRMLRLVADTLARVGGGGRAFSCEGHAFAILFRRTSAAVAGRHLERVRKAVEVATLDVRVLERARPGRPDRPGVVERTVAVTISAGVAQPETRGADPHDVLRRAGRALDHAKQAGLNRVVLASPGT